MSRQEEALRLAEDLVTDVELGQTSTARRVLKASRLARLTNDDEALAWLRYELNGVPGNEAGRKWMDQTQRWIDKKEDKGYWGSAASIEGSRDAQQAAMAGHSAPMNLAGEWANVTMSKRSAQINQAAASLIYLNRALSAIDNKVYRFAADTYARLKFSEVQASLFDDARRSVDIALSGMTGSSLKMIESVAERLGSDDASAVSQAMTTCRQLIDAVADHVFPPSGTPYSVGDRELEVTADKVKNRINAYIHECGVVGSRAERLGKALNIVSDRVSAAVHNPNTVSGHEARYLFLSTYMLLGEILTIGSA